jgi:hypothetical protein
MKVAGEVAFEAAQRALFGLAFGFFAREVRLGDQVTPKVLGRRRRQKLLWVRPTTTRTLQSARRQPENQPHPPDVIRFGPATMTLTKLSRFDWPGNDTSAR